MGKRNIRMLVLGDGDPYAEGVGKTTLIQSLVSDNFPEDVPPVTNPIQVPLDGTNTEHIATIVDTACSAHVDRGEEDSDGTIEEELQKANVILLLYEITRPDTMQRVSTYWLPRISAITSIPVIFVGTKADLRPSVSQHAEDFEDTMRSLVRDNKQCEAMIECSAKSLLNVSDLFYCAQRLVLYPSAPLFNPANRELTPAFVRALKFVFRRFNSGRNKVLSRRELMTLNLEVFGIETPEVDTDQVITLVGRECPEGVTDEGLTFYGFQQLMKLMILRLKMQFCWVLLRHFGFSDSLALEVHCSVSKSSGRSVCLTPAAFHFLSEVFAANAERGVLSFESLKEVFSTCASPPWAPQRRDEAVWTAYEKYVRTTPELGLTIDSWLALWWLLVWTDHANAYQYLWMIGLQMDASKTFHTVAAKTPCVYILGVAGTGKTSLLESFIRKPFKEETYPTSSVRCVCDVVHFSSDLSHSQFLILKEVPQVELETLLKTTQTAEECTLVCLLADGSQASVSFLKNPLLTYFRSEVPKIVVRTKGDLLPAVEFAYDRVVALKRERPNELFAEFLSLSSAQEASSSRDSLLFSAATVGLLVLGTLTLVWAIRRFALRSA